MAGPHDGPAMREPDLLEGERVQRVVHPHPLARLADLAPGALLLGVGAMLATGTWLGASLEGLRGELAVPLLLVTWWVLLALIVVPFALLARGGWMLGLGVALAVAGGLGVVLAGAGPRSLGGGAVVGGLLGLGLGEWERRSEGWFLTNYRVVHRAGRWRPREEAWLLHRVKRADTRSGRWAAMGFGDVVLDLGDGHEAALRGVARTRELRDDIELLLHTPREPPYLGDQRHVADKVMGLLRREDAARR